MIEVESLTKRYGDRAAIKDVTFKVPKGEIMGFLGPNGAGKTTTMRILAGVMGATEGRAKVAGFDVSDEPREAKRRTGYLPEHPPVYPDMTVQSYIDYAARLHGVPRSERAGKVDLALQKANLGDVRGRLIGHLSKGFQQRVGLAQALVHDPEVLILDEPTVGLDPSQIKDIRSLIRGLAGQHTIILSTHILPEVEATCERVVVIHQGRIIKEGSIKGIRQEMSGQGQLDIEVARPSDAILTALSALPGIGAVTAGAEAGRYTLTYSSGADPREAVGQALVSGGWGLLELQRRTASLEDIFVQLTTHEQLTENAGEAEA